MLPRDPISSPDNPVTLATAQKHDQVRVLRVSGRPRLIQRLAELGVVPGVMLTVLKPSKPSIISLGGARIAIGETAAESVEIEIEP